MMEGSDANIQSTLFGASVYLTVPGPANNRAKRRNWGGICWSRFSNVSHRDVCDCLRPSPKGFVGGGGFNNLHLEFTLGTSFIVRHQRVSSPLTGFFRATRKHSTRMVVVSVVELVAFGSVAWGGDRRGSRWGEGCGA